MKCRHVYMQAVLQREYRPDWVVFTGNVIYLYIGKN
jgi:hypothetical protein